MSQDFSRLPGSILSYLGLAFKPPPYLTLTTGGAKSPPVCVNSGVYFFSIAGMDNLGFSVTSPPQVLATTVTIGHEFPFQGYAASGADIVSMTIPKQQEKEHRLFVGVPFASHR